MSTLAILGRQSELSLAELESVIGAEAIQPIGKQAILTTEPNLTHLGGTIKLAKILTTAKHLDAAALEEAVATLPSPDGKLTVGLSYYGRSHESLGLGMQIKKLLRAKGQSVRLVLPKARSSQLTAAQLKFNGLAKADSPELIILEQPSRVIIARTTQYQDIDAYSARDFDRPERSTRVGMLPPKLAQILVNLAGLKSGIILDPFCGGGVVLQEARLLGFEVIGSDLALEMVKASRINLEWLDQNYPDLPKWQVSQQDARTLKLDRSIGAIVSEGDLGPAFSSSPNRVQIGRAAVANSELVTSFLKNLQPQLAPGMPVVLCLPQWQIGNAVISPPVIDEIYRLGYTSKQFAHCHPNELVYRRPGQIVGRQILVMKKQ